MGPRAFRALAVLACGGEGRKVNVSHKGTTWVSSGYNYVDWGRQRKNKNLRRGIAP